MMPNYNVIFQKIFFTYIDLSVIPPPRVCVLLRDSIQVLILSFHHVSPRDNTVSQT